MFFVNHLKEQSYVVSCPKCKRKFKVYETNQIPGFRDTEDMICPYCGEKVKTSMEYEYTTEKIGELYEN